MSTLLTKGGLTPGKLKEIKKDGSDGKVVNFMFNPEKYTLTKTTSWTKTDQTGSDVPKFTFKTGSPMTLGLTLHFDTLDTLKNGKYTSVRDHTKALYYMMGINAEYKNDDTEKSQPPLVSFEWGGVEFKKAYIMSFIENVTLFSETGTPLRCNVVLALTQYYDPNENPPQVPDQPTWVTTAPKTSTFTAGMRLDLVAAFSGTAQKIGSAVREIAEKNNIDDPLNIPNGTSLLT